MKSLFTFIFLLAFGAIGLIGSSGCANIIPPSGGPRDSLPPVLVSATPKDSSVNFRGNRIVLNFDEYVDLQDVQSNILFTPTFERPPIVDARLRTLTIRLRDTLDPNTTYIFNFGNAIKDINEGNVLKDFVYTVSTGPALDSLELRGKVIMAETGKVDSTLIVVLHKNRQDSAVYNQRPRYVARLDGSGNFTFRNLPRDTFAIYAIGDAGVARRYTSPTQAFAFLDSAVVAGAATPLNLYAYKELPERADQARTTSAATTDKRLRFTTSLVNGNQLDLGQNLVMNFERPLRSFDSARVRLAKDTSFTPVTFSAQLDSARTAVTFKTAWEEGTRYSLIMEKEFAEDTLGRMLLKTDTLTFSTRKREEYGSIDIRVRNIEATQNPVLLFVQNDKVVFAAPIKGGRFTSDLFQPGDYDLRILYDRNNNGVWDAGKFFEGKRQPELVRPLERKITVKPAWENEFEVTL